MRKQTARNILLAGAFGLTYLLSGCVKVPDENAVPENYPVEPARGADYFAKLPMYSETGLAMTSADFDGDGDMDLIVGAYDSTDGFSAKLYYFQNDGKGNFTLMKNR